LAAAAIMPLGQVAIAKPPSVTTPTAPALSGASLSLTGTGALSLTPIGTYRAGSFDVGAAEIADYDPISKRLFVVNGGTNAIDILNIADPVSPTLVSSIAISPTYGAGATSVSVYDGVVAASIVAPVETDPGTVAFFDTNGAFISSVKVGALPDMVTWTRDGRKVLTADEGQPNNAYTIDPEGSVSVIEFPDGIANPVVYPVTFTDFNAGGSRYGEIEAMDAASRSRFVLPTISSVAQNIEPEYITVSPDNTRAYVTLQENNAVAILDITTECTVLAIVPLGFKDHALAGNALDASDRDGRINIANWPVKGMYQPDAIASFAKDGTTYLVTANEGDARDYAGYSEVTRAGSSSFVLDPATFPNAADLKTDAQIGRLNVTTQTGSIDGSFKGIYAFGARSFTIWNGATGAVVFDSGDHLEKLTAAAYPAFFNASNSNNTFDNRSDDKGPEPEAVVIGALGGKTYAFVGLERIGGVAVYDVSDPAAPVFVTYANNRNFLAAPNTAAARDLGPEGLRFISAADSPNGKPLLIVANEVSGTITVMEITLSEPDGAGRLTLVHNNDGESSLLPIQQVVPANTFGFGNTSVQTLTISGAAVFKTVLDRELSQAKSFGNSTISVYAGDAFLASATLLCSLPITDTSKPVLDAVAQRQMPYTAHIIGNHEFDFTPDFLERFIRDFRDSSGKPDQPFLSANLDFSGEPGFNTLVEPDGMIDQSVQDGRAVARAMIYTDPATGQRFGIVGGTTPTLPTISSPRNVKVTPDIPTTAAAIQTEIDKLQALGVRKIILVSHMQSITNDRELIALLRGVDIAVAGGGDDLLASTFVPTTTQLIPAEARAIAGTYPLPVSDAISRTVYVVTSDGNYRYAGRLDVDFDSNGEVARIVRETSYPRRIVQTGTSATALGLSDAAVPDPGIVTTVSTPTQACLSAFASTGVARSEVALDVSRGGVRARETNGGNLIADAFAFVYDQYATLPVNGLPARGPGNPVVAVQNGGGIRQNAGNVIPPPTTAPTISRQNTLDVLAFLTNQMTVITGVTPAEVETIFERSAASLPGEGGQFLQVSGISVTINVSNPVNSRVIAVTLADGTPIIANGSPVAGAPNITIVTNSFTAGGGDNYPTFAARTTKRDLRNAAGTFITYEDALVDYLQNFSGFPLVNGLRTVPASDPRYATATGQGRIRIVTVTGGSGTNAFGNPPGVNVLFVPTLRR
jgi:2',3'-cyclic-nucleotide 2'-phosphodiesterase (5'-nucleotidase family)